MIFFGSWVSLPIHIKTAAIDKTLPHSSFKTIIGNFPMVHCTVHLMKSKQVEMDQKQGTQIYCTKKYVENVSDNENCKLWWKFSNFEVNGGCKNVQLEAT